MNVSQPSLTEESGSAKTSRFTAQFMLTIMLYIAVGTAGLLVSDGLSSINWSEMVIFIAVYAIGIFTSYRINYGVYVGLINTSLVSLILLTGYENSAIVPVLVTLVILPLLGVIRAALPVYRKHPRLNIMETIWRGGVDGAVILLAGWLFSLQIINFDRDALSLLSLLPAFGLVIFLFITRLGLLSLGISMQGGVVRSFWRTYWQPMLANELVISLLCIPIVLAGFEGTQIYRLLGVLLYLLGGLVTYGITRGQIELSSRHADMRVLNRIGQALTAELELEDLLERLYLELSELFDMSGFYLALYDESDQSLSFVSNYQGGSKLPPVKRPFQNSVTEHIILTRKPLLLTHDVYAEAERIGLDPIGSGAESYLGVPITVGDTIIGVMALRSYTEKHAFTNQDIRTLQTISATVGIALQNAQLFEQSQRQANDLYSLHAASSIASKSTELDAAVGDLCGLVIQALACSKAAIFLFDEVRQVFYLAGSVGLSTQYQEWSVEISAKSVRATSGVSGENLVVGNILEDKRFTEQWGRLAAEKISAILETPLRHGDKIIGTLSAYFPEPMVFEPAQIELMQTLGAQIGLAVRNTSLLESVSSQRQELETLFDSGRMINTSLSLDDVLQTVGEIMIHTLGINVCAILLNQPEAQRLEMARWLTQANGQVINQVTQRTVVAPLSSFEDLQVLQARTLPFTEISRDSRSLGWTRLIAHFGLESATAVLMMAQGKLVGMILLGNQTGSTIMDPVSKRLACALADQAAMAIRNAQLYDQTDAALNRKLEELAALELITQRMTSNLDMQSVIDLVVTTAMASTVTNFCEVALFDEGKNLIRVISREGIQHTALESAQWSAELGLTGRALQTRQTVRSGNVLNDPDYIAARPTTRSELVVPIILNDRRLGVINLESESIDAFDEDQERFITSLAEHAAVAIQNASLFEKISQRAEDLQTLRAIAVELLSSAELEPTLNVIAREALDRTRANDVNIYLYDRAQDALTFGIGLAASGEIAVPESPVSSITQVVARSGDHVVIKAEGHQRLDEDMQPGSEETTLEAMASVPIKRGDEVIGVFNLTFEDSTLVDDDTLKFLELLAAQAAVAIANAQLYESERKQRQISETLYRTTAAITQTIDFGEVLLTLASNLLELSGNHICIIYSWDKASQTVRALVDVTRAVYPLGHGEMYLLEEFTATEKAITQDVPVLVTLQEESPDLDSEQEWMRLEGLSSLAQIPVFIDGVDKFLVEIGWSHIVSQDYFSEIIDTISASLSADFHNFALPLSSNPEHLLFDIAQKYIKETGGQIFYVSTLDDNRRLVQTSFAYSNLIWKDGEGPSISLADSVIVSRVLHQEIQSTVIDATDSDLDDLALKDMARWDVQSLVVQPLVHQGESIGVVMLMNVQGSVDSSEDTLHLLQAVSDQATVTLTNTRLAQQITTAHDRLQAILDSIHDGILMFDISGRLVMANTRVEWLLNRKVSDYLGMHFVDVVRSLRREDPETEWFNSKQTIEIARSVLSNLTSITRRNFTIESPERRVIDETSIPVTAASGNLVGRLFILRDITKEHDVNLYREEMSGMLVHDLRSPLSNIITGLTIANEEITSIEDEFVRMTLETTVGVSLRSAEAMLDLVEQILDVNKLEAGEMPLEPREVLLAERVMYIIERYQAAAEDANIDLVCAVPDDLGPVHVDANKITRVLANLVDNAMRYTPDGGKIKVAVEPGDGLQTVIISDSGAGVREDLRERIFERFTQGNTDTRYRGTKGSGLGLTFCRLAVEAHGGHIWVQEGELGGAAFHFTLPTQTGKTPNGAAPTG